MALRRGRIARRVIGFSRREATVRRAKVRGALHDGDTELCPNWLGESDLVVLAVPPDDILSVARGVARLTRHSFVLTDTTSAKGPIVAALEKALPPRIRFVGSHPMAGSERSGIEAANPDLFRGAACVVTRTARTEPAALQRVSRMWQRVGGRIIVLDPKRHDRLVAQVSHAPHLAAVALTLLPEAAALPLAGGGFSDLTRVAGSDPEMWEQICRANAPSVLKAMARYAAEMEDLRHLIRAGRWAELRRRLRAAQRRRQRLPQ